MSTTVQVREVLRCPHCDLNQFATVSGNCRRCQKPYVEPEAAPIVLESRKPGKLFATRGSGLRQATSRVLLVCRGASGLSRSEMGRQFPCPRTYISKTENGRALPGPMQLAKLAEFFGISPYWLVTMIEGAMESRADTA